MRNLRNSKGFTLIELMIVVVIIGILAAIAIPKFGQASDRAKEKEADGILKQVYTMQETYRAANGGPAADIAALTTVGFEEPTNLKNYTWVLGTNSVTLPLCLASKGTGTPTHKAREISAAGDITSKAGATC
jgi:prepilin-type N-terminal cleavage/methylation domain-containing protein